MGSTNTKLFGVFLVFILIATISFADTPFFTAPPKSATNVLVDEIGFALPALVSLMLFMVVLAAGVYAVGQVFGAETRARATVWSHNMLAAVGVGALLLILMYVLLPGFTSGNIVFSDIMTQLATLRNLVESGLLTLIFSFLVIAAAVYAIGQTSGSETRARATVWATNLLTAAIISAVIYVLIFKVLEILKPSLYSTVVGPYIDVILQVCVVVSLIIVITYMAAKVFKIQEWEAYLNIELSNLFSSFLLMMFFLGFFAASTSISNALVSSGSSATPSLAAISFIRTNIADSVLRASVDVYSIQACTSMLSTFTRRIGEFVLTQTYKVFPGIDTFVSITNVLAPSLISLYATVTVQMSLLYIADATMFTVFLPAGLILRFIPPTRDAGAFLIAFAFGFQIVFPTMYLLNAKIYQELGGEVYSSPTVLIQSLCGPLKYGAAGYIFNPANMLFGLTPGLTTIGGYLAKFFSEGLLNMVSMAEFIPIMKAVASLSLLSLFIPALSMMITIAFINSMTKFITTKM